MVVVDHPITIVWKMGSHPLGTLTAWKATDRGWAKLNLRTERGYIEGGAYVQKLTREDMERSLYRCDVEGETRVVNDLWAVDDVGIKALSEGGAMWRMQTFSKCCKERSLEGVGFVGGWIIVETGVARLTATFLREVPH